MTNVCSVFNNQYTRDIKCPPFVVAKRATPSQPVYTSYTVLNLFVSDLKIKTDKKRMFDIADFYFITGTVE